MPASPVSSTKVSSRRAIGKASPRPLLAATLSSVSSKAAHSSVDQSLSEHVARETDVAVATAAAAVNPIYSICA